MLLCRSPHHASVTTTTTQTTTTLSTLRYPGLRGGGLWPGAPALGEGELGTVFLGLRRAGMRSIGHEGGGRGSGILGPREEIRAPQYTTDSLCLLCPHPARNPSALCSGSLPSEPSVQSRARLSSMVSFRAQPGVRRFSPTDRSCSSLSLVLGGRPRACPLPIQLFLPPSLPLAPFPAAGEGPANPTGL